MWRWVKSCSAVGVTLPSLSRYASIVVDQVGLVLLVVGRERRHGLLVEALELARVLAHRRQQQPVGARVLEREQLEPVGLGDVGGQLRLLAGAVEIDRVGHPAAARHRDVKARQRRARARAQRRGRPLELRRRRRPGRSRCTSARSPASASSGDRARAAARSARSATTSTRARQSPVCAARGAARAKITPAPALEPAAELGGAGDDVAAVGHLARRAPRATNSPAASSLAHSGARERSSSSASSVETIRISVGDGSAPRLR